MTDCDINSTETAGVVALKLVDTDERGRWVVKERRVVEQEVSLNECENGWDAHDVELLEVGKVDDADDLHEYLGWQHVEELVNVGIGVECGEGEALACVAEVGVCSCQLEVSSVKVYMAMFEVSTWVRAIASTRQSGSTPVLFINADVERVDLGVNVGVAEVAGNVVWAGHFCVLCGKREIPFS